MTSSDQKRNFNLCDPNESIYHVVSMWLKEGGRAQYRVNENK